MEQDPIQFEGSFRRFATELAIPINDSCVPLFFHYLCELKKWNKAINLTAIDDDEEILIKHFVDSLAGIKVIDNTSKNEFLDVGAGAGFPSLPLKFLLPQLELELLEPSEKKGSFLRYVIGSLGLRQMTVVPAKLEQYVRRQNRRTFNYIVVRAFKVDESGRLLADLLKPDGKVILYRAERIPRGFALAGLALVDEVEYELPSGYGHRVLSVFSK
ncbi:MAG: 16S rRNA (guanine(527)-N(7))-methyltransferase RsmG [Nitrospira sp.]|nr:16S rRNA (guanine(527)-N(7))-methyltransferase RsmG [Nitrospira sp.]